ncbi:MAG: hypothetical protein VXZ96_03645 [Myxococcota bacterium]|nr:hypothetical protein [Myxococcota bacterium]
MWFFLLSCWAPEVAPPAPSQSPSEPFVTEKPPAEFLINSDENEPPSPKDSADKTEFAIAQDGQDNLKSPLLKDSAAVEGLQNTHEMNNSSHMDTEEPLEENEAQASTPTPPFTTWTTANDLSLHGPRGGFILSIKRKGVRIEVLSIVEDWAHVICSGCAPPTQNQAGWVPASKIQHPDEIGRDTPLGLILQYRRDWAKAEDIPDGIEPIDLCMLVDAGFETDSEFVEWQYNDGQIILDLSQPDSAPQITPPLKHQEIGWRCAIERGVTGNPI